MIDVHAHILPNLDDGPSSIEESIKMCRLATEDGIRTVIATPHMLKDMYPLSRQDVIDKVDVLNTILKEHEIDLKIVPGAEVAIVPDLFDRFMKGDLITVGNSKRHIFIELTDYFPEKEITSVLKSLLDENVIPIISHPERNITIQNNLSILEKFVEMGALSQLTAMSITGDFGYRAQRSATKILKRGFSHFTATDAHSLLWRPPVLSKAMKRISRIIGQEKAREQVMGSGLNILTVD